MRTPGTLGKGKQGAAMIAAKAGVGFLPIGIETTYKFRSRVKMTVGDYIDFSKYYNQRLSSEELQKITDEVLMPEIAKLAGAKVYGN